MKTPIPYYGGKTNLLADILPLIPPSHSIYVEPFFGGGAVFWGKENRNARHYREVINDRNELVYNFWRVCREDFEALQHRIWHTPHCRRTWQEAKERLQDPEPVVRAWAFWVQIMMSFSKKLGSGWTYSRVGPNNSLTTFTRINEFTEKIRNRLAGVYIENQDAVQVIKTWDSADTFFLLDPPYPNANQGHYKGYTMADFEALLDACAGMKGKFLLCSYPYPELYARAEAEGWHIRQKEQTISAANSAKGQNPGKKIEQFTLNYPPPGETLRLF